MTWFYPFSHFSAHKSYTYKPGKVLYNDDQTYKDILNEFKESYEKELDNEFENTNNGIDLTIDRTRYILPIFEQDWLIGTDPVSMDKNKLDKMLVDVKQTTDSLLDLVANEDYTSQEKGYLINSIKNFLRLEESITRLKEEKYFSRNELSNLFGNLRNHFRSNFDLFVTFYERSH